MGLLYVVPLRAQFVYGGHTRTTEEDRARPPLAAPARAQPADSLTHTVSLLLACSQFSYKPLSPMKGANQTTPTRHMRHPHEL